MGRSAAPWRARSRTRARACYLAGRTAGTLDEVAGQIRAAGGRAETAVVDALDEQAVDAHADAVAAEAGRIDISFNLISHRDVQGTPMVDMSVDDYMRPVLIGVRTTFLTCAGGGAPHEAPGRRRDPRVRRLRRPPFRDYTSARSRPAFARDGGMRRQLRVRARPRTASAS